MLSDKDSEVKGGGKSLRVIVATMTDPTTLIAKLQLSFENAHNAGDLYFFPSTVVTHNDSEIEVIDIVKLGLERIQAC